MGLRVRLAVVGAVAAVTAVALAGTGLGSAALARLGGTGASAAARPHYVDVSDQFRSDPGWGMARGLIAPDPVASVVAAHYVYVPLTGPPPASGQAALRGLQLSRAGLLPAPGCSGAACGTDGCGFLAPGCALLDCGLLNPACGLGIPVSSCGILDPGCGFGGCGLFGSGCFGFDEEHSLFERLRFDELFDRHRFRFDDHRRFDFDRDGSHHRH